MTIEEQAALISRQTEEVMTNDDLMTLLASKQQLRHYIGFEISGKIHLGTGLMCMQKVKDLHDAGIECNIFLADWHTWINDKLDGSHDTIRRVAVGYFKEGLRAAYVCVGGNPDDLKFTLGSELYAQHPHFWDTVVEVSKQTSLSRAKRSITIMGRGEGDNVDFAKLLYPMMQVADIFTQQIHLPHAGLDQRKAQVIARDVALKLNISPLLIGGKKVKPVAVHHHLILGLQKPSIWPIVDVETKQDIWTSMKMSKSKPDSAIFIHDSEEDIRRKIARAFCPEREIEFNPIIDWVEHLLANPDGFTIRRTEAHGGNVKFKDISTLKSAFQSGELHPQDLKNFVAEELIKKLEPARITFASGKPQKMLAELEAIIAKSN